MALDKIAICKAFYAKRMERLTKCGEEVKLRNDALEHNLAIARQQKAIFTEPADLLSLGEKSEHYKGVAEKNKRNSEELFLRNIVTARKSLEDFMGALNGKITRKFAEPKQ